MSIAVARVPAHAHVPWTILTFVLKVETPDLVPPLETLAHDFQRLRDELVPLIAELDRLVVEIASLWEETQAFQTLLVPLWDDTYSLCGRASCPGTCVLCREGEGETYCRRRR